MQIIKATDRDQWNRFVVENSSPSSFLQSWEWGEFQKSLGLKIYRVGIAGERGELIAAAQVIVRPLYFSKTYLEVPKGPVGHFDKEIWDMLNSELKRIGSEHNTVLIRISPPYQNNFQFSIFNFQKPEILNRQIEPENTVLVDLSKSEDELMARMHEKSRYNIRLAIKKGVKIEEQTGDRVAFEKFLDLINETSKRDGITVWPRQRFWKFRNEFMVHNSPQPSLSLREGAPPLKLRGGGGELLDSNRPRAILLTGSYEGKILAVAIIMLFGDTGTYLYAASSAEHRNANVPSLVLWEAIRRTKLAGKKYYDMWGIAPTGAGEEHSWSGITRFKSRYVTIGLPAPQTGVLRTGETGAEKHYIGTRDLILDKKYYTLFKIAKKLRG